MPLAEQYAGSGCSAFDDNPSHLSLTGDPAWRYGKARAGRWEGVLSLRSSAAHEHLRSEESRLPGMSLAVICLLT